MTVGEMQQRMTHTEFTYWMAYQAVSPIGDERADLRAGIVASQVNNSNVTNKKDLKKPTDYMLFYKAPTEPEFDRDAFFTNLKKYAIRKP